MSFIIYITPVTVAEMIYNQAGFKSNYPFERRKAHGKYT
jgi:hypothetical protein